jgi:hypothetical protein
MLTFGYTRGVPPSVDTAWGCRALVEQNGMVDALWDRVDLVGPDQTQLTEHLDHHVGTAWHERASELLRNGVMRTDRDEEFVLYEDSTVVIKGNTQRSHGYLYVCAYLRPRCEAFARKGTGVGSCDQLLDERGDCLRVSDHIE